jgi:hypothetical protein
MYLNVIASFVSYEVVLLLWHMPVSVEETTE